MMERFLKRKSMSDGETTNDTEGSPRSDSENIRETNEQRRQGNKRLRTYIDDGTENVDNDRQRRDRQEVMNSESIEANINEEEVREREKMIKRYIMMGEDKLKAMAEMRRSYEKLMPMLNENIRVMNECINKTTIMMAQMRDVVENYNKLDEEQYEISLRIGWQYTKDPMIISENEQVTKSNTNSETTINRVDVDMRERRPLVKSAENSVVIHNLNYRITKEWLEDKLKEHKPIVECIKNKGGDFIGCAIVTVRRQSRDKLLKLNNTNWMGRNIRIEKYIDRKVIRGRRDTYRDVMDRDSMNNYSMTDNMRDRQRLGRVGSMRSQERLGMGSSKQEIETETVEVIATETKMVKETETVGVKGTETEIETETVMKAIDGWEELYW